MAMFEEAKKTAVERNQDKNGNVMFILSKMNLQIEWEYGGDKEDTRPSSMDLLHEMFLTVNFLKCLRTAN